jgi:hypothetical protein
VSAMTGAVTIVGWAKALFAPCPRGRGEAIRDVGMLRFTHPTGPRVGYDERVKA